MPTGLCRGYVTLAASGAIYLYGEYVYIYIYIHICHDLPGESLSISGSLYVDMYL